ncbi:MAG TPA: divergent polysaccharide deacetylase family protein, partial [Acidiphilium sp.]|nr:divergent polysaccharide deacetylase family protein [Acidiphilium sp.]
MRAIRIARSVGRFWAGVGLATVIGGATLAVLGSPLPAKPPRTTLLRHLYHGAIPPPDPKLLVGSPANPAWMIPQQSGKTSPMTYYAAPAHIADGLHRVAILVGGIGEALTPSLDAVTSLPPSVSLALTPYGPHLQQVAIAARKAGHETLLGLPMETSREPTVTEGDEA